MQIRKCDKWGCGHFGASRGDRKHNGVDLVWTPGDRAFCLMCGIVTKLGYPYADDLSFRYVEITEDGNRWRYFYVDPIVNVGDELDAYTEIGEYQGLGERYPGITEHVHCEIIGPDGEYIDPTPRIAE